MIGVSPRAGGPGGSEGLSAFPPLLGLCVVALPVKDVSQPQKAQSRHLLVAGCRFFEDAQPHKLFGDGEQQLIATAVHQVVAQFGESPDSLSPFARCARPKLSRTFCT